MFHPIRPSLGPKNGILRMTVLRCQSWSLAAIHSGWRSADANDTGWKGCLEDCQSQSTRAGTPTGGQIGMMGARCGSTGCHWGYDQMPGVIMRYYGVRINLQCIYPKGWGSYNML
jgi:hypothetical protein